MRALTPRSRRAIVAASSLAIVIAGSIAASRSPRVRAAYQAFRDPGRLDARPAEPDVAATPAPIAEIDLPDLSSDYDRAGPEDLADAGAETIGSLTWPDLDFPPSRKTMRFVGYFAATERGRQAFIERYRRGGRYRAHIEQALRDADLPEDLVWLSAIESGFNPQAISPKGAVGLFQFMPETAARYGLLQSEQIDERRSITRSTAAAIAYLRDLFARYGRWDLALAAYNYGEDRLDESIEKLRARRPAKSAKDPVELKDLAEAHLVPKETASFVPQIQAFAIVAANRGRFGLDDLAPLEPFEIGEIAVPAGTPLRLVSKAAGVSIEVIRDYNPDLLRAELPSSGGDLLVNVPADRVARALASFPALLARNAPSAAPDAPSSASVAPPTTSARVALSADAVAAPHSDDRLVLPDGITLAFDGAPGPEITIEPSVELFEPTRTGVRASGKVLRIAPSRVPAADLERGLERAAAALRAMIQREAAVALRRSIAAPRRIQIEHAPYGKSWIALSDHLFPEGHPLQGSLAAAPLLPLLSVVIAEPPPQGALRATVTLSFADRKIAAALAPRALASALDPGPASPLFPREERLAVTESVPSPRALFGWIGPPGDDASSPALRLGMLLLAHDRFGSAARALVSETHVAVHVRGSIENLPRASVVAIEVAPSVKYDVAACEKELDRAIAAFAEQGPSAPELAEAKAQLRARLDSERARAGSPDEPKAAALARIARTAAAAEAVTASDVTAVVKRIFSPAHRVVITTEPR
ncbi:MAG: transglycosylase SLT domain-containing protein [Byssovorax sp.]